MRPYEKLLAVLRSAKAGKMGTIIGRTCKDGSNAFVAQIVIKKLVQSSTARRRLLTASKLANVWIVKREAARAARPHRLAYCAD